MNKEELKIELNKIGTFSNEQINKLESFMDATLLANEKFNLTAIKDKEKFRELMILDSAYPLRYFDFEGKKIIDIGTGAGYPGMVLATLTNGEFTLLDSTKKKVSFYGVFAANNGYSNVIPVCERAENYSRNHREEYDFVIARAVADLNVLVEIILPLLKVNGHFIALKGAKGLDELEKAKSIISKLGGEVVSIDQYDLPESGEKRINIIIRKAKSSPIKYPRDYSKIVKSPIR